MYWKIVNKKVCEVIATQTLNIETKKVEVQYRAYYGQFKVGEYMGEDEAIAGLETYIASQPVLKTKKKRKKT